MDGLKKGVFIFYLLYTGYSILVCGTTNLSVWYLIPAFIIMWLIYILFDLGTKGRGYNPHEKKTGMKVINTDMRIFGIDILNTKPLYLFMIAGISVAIAVVSVHFYTGKWPGAILSNIFRGGSNYIEYQMYFKQANIGAFSLSKIPYILLLGINNIIFVYSFIIILCNEKKVKLRHIIYLCIVSFSHLYFGVARGTNFEAYKLFLILSYCYIIKKEILKKKVNYMLIATMGIILVIIYIIVLDARNAQPDYNVATYILYDKEAFFSVMFPNISKYYLFLYGYLGFGIYYIATMINEIWFGSVLGFLGGVIPGLNQFAGIDAIERTNILVDIGVKWVPDGASILNLVGIFGLFGICYFLGRFFKNCKNSSVGGVFPILWGYFIFVFFCSLPVGHFLSFSSEELLIAYTVVVYFYKRKRIRFLWR